MKKREFIRDAALGACFLACRRVATPAFGMESFWDNGVPAPDKLWKWSREAYFYKLTDRGVECTNCPNACSLKPGETGKCRNRINYLGKLYSIAYGNPCALHVDPIEKKPFFHFLPSTFAFSLATAGCNLACLNCQNWEISQKSPKETRNYDLMPPQVSEQCIASNCRSIAYTYSEPTVFYEYVYDSAVIAHEKGLKNVYKSNGYIQEKPLRKLCKYLDAANIDLKGFNNATYVKLNSGKLEPVLRSLKVLKEEGVWLEITNLVVPSWTDNPAEIKEMCRWLVANNLAEAPLHFSRFSPMYKLAQLPVTPVDTLVKARNIALEAGMKFVYIGNVPGLSYENTYCPSCNKILVERKGFAVISNGVKDGKCPWCSTGIAGKWT